MTILLTSLHWSPDRVLALEAVSCLTCTMVSDVTMSLDVTGVVAV